MSSELFLIFFGLSALVALVVSKLATLAKFPLVVGYLLAGTLFGPAIFNIVTKQQVASLDVINTLVLSFIGFGVGGELKVRDLKKMGKSIIVIVIFEATVTFLMVGMATAAILKNIPMGMIYGALASATAPAGTVDVIRQYKAEGNLTKTLYAVMGLDDIYALLLYTIAIPLAIIYLGGHTEVSIPIALLHAGWEVLQAVGIGTIVGFIMVFVAKRIHERLSFLLFSLGFILLNCGISELLDISPILLNMVVGFVVVNTNSLVSKKLFGTLGDWTPPIYLWFFVLIGTRLDFHLIINYSFLVIAYILSRTLGKWSGGFLGAKMTKAPGKTVKYLGFTLLSQAGVAIGLSLAAAKSLEAMNMHSRAVQVVSVMTATTVIIMLIGPILAKMALFKAGEAKVRD